MLFIIKPSSDVPMDLIFLDVITLKVLYCSLSMFIESFFNLFSLHKDMSAPVSIKNVSITFLPKLKFMKLVKLFDIWKTLFNLLGVPPDDGFVQFLDSHPEPGTFPVQCVHFYGTSVPIIIVVVIIIVSSVISVCIVFL